MGRYKILVDEEGIELKSQEKFRFACCDCGLVHDMVIATRKRGEPVGLAVKRNRRATTMRRKHIG